MIADRISHLLNQIEKSIIMAIPIHVFARWKVKDGNIQAVLKLLKEVRSKTEEEKGNLFYKINQSQTDANTLMLFEGYVDDVAQREHVNADYYKEVVVK